MLQVTLNLDDAQVKELFKQAILELLQEKDKAFYELIAEVVEDIALAQAIEEGRSSNVVSKAEILQILGEAA